MVGCMREWVQALLGECMDVCVYGWVQVYGWVHAWMGAYMGVGRNWCMHGWVRA